MEGYVLFELIFEGLFALLLEIELFLHIFEPFKTFYLVLLFD